MVVNISKFLNKVAKQLYALDLAYNPSYNQDPQDGREIEVGIDHLVTDYKQRFAREWESILDKALDDRQYELLSYGETVSGAQKDLALFRRLGVEQAKSLLHARVDDYENIRSILYAEKYIDIWDVYSDFWSHLERDIEHEIRGAYEDLQSQHRWVQ